MIDAAAPARPRGWRPSLALGRALPGARRAAGLLQRWLGFLFFWAFLALWFQMEGLIGPSGILPAGDLLTAVRQADPGASLASGLQRWLLIPSLLWIGSGTFAVHLLCAAGLAAAVLVMARLYPRWALAVCLVCFLSFLSTAQVFASYQSDGMLMTAGVIGLFLDAEKPNWWSFFSLRWLWFTIYFGSGWAKWASGDPQWRHLTALDHYYENGPLPAALGWYAQNLLPHGIEATIALAILVMELGLAWLCFGPRRARITLFWITTPFQIAIILTANYGFLNWLVLGLGFALLDDRHLRWLARPLARRRSRWPPRSARGISTLPPPENEAPATVSSGARWSNWVLIALVLITALNLGHRVWRRIPAPERVDTALAPFRVVDSFGLFAVMTRARYEIEFQGTNDGITWTPYPFRFKPQDPARAPGWFGPYQPRFDWNLWFASLGTYADNPWVEETEIGLLRGDAAVLGLFAHNPFPQGPPRAVRAVLWQYWFSTPAQQRQQHIWWTRRQLGLYAPLLARPAD
ncbi:MAG TPA: lipase maturation factor family protein [Terriglobales bacterium]